MKYTRFRSTVIIDLSEQDMSFLGLQDTFKELTSALRSFEIVLVDMKGVPHLTMENRSALLIMAWKASVMGKEIRFCGIEPQLMETFDSGGKGIHVSTLSRKQFEKIRDFSQPF